jgi:hypothetical protein
MAATAPAPATTTVPRSHSTAAHSAAAVHPAAATTAALRHRHTRTTDQGRDRQGNHCKSFHDIPPSGHSSLD